MTYKYEHKIKMYSLGVYVARQNQLKFFGVDSTYLTDAEKSKIVETLLTGAPFPPVIIYEEKFDTILIKNGEIIKVLIEFVNNKFKLENISCNDNYYYFDFTDVEKRRFLNKIIVTYMLNDIPNEDEINDINSRFRN